MTLSAALAIASLRTTLPVESFAIRRAVSKGIPLASMVPEDARESNNGKTSNNGTQLGNRDSELIKPDSARRRFQPAMNHEEQTHKSHEQVQAICFQRNNSCRAHSVIEGN